MVEIPIKEGLYPMKDGISYPNVLALLGRSSKTVMEEEKLWRPLFQGSKYDSVPKANLEYM